MNGLNCPFARQRTSISCPGIVMSTDGVPHPAGGRPSPMVFVPFLCTLLLLLVAEMASGRDYSQLSEYQTTTWRVEDGLPQSTVTCIAQTPDGYLWLGTQNGLVRFDGVRFRVFDENNTPAIKNSRVVRLLGGPDGTLWVGTEHGGLVCRSNGHF